MTDGRTHSLVPYGVGLAVLAAALHLGWELTHGGVKSHHLLANPDLPAISNWWGLLILPGLGWVASRVVAGRARNDDGAVTRAGAGFVGAAMVGIALSAAFTAGYDSTSSLLFFGVLASGLVLPVYRAEYIFGFVLGMTFVFGSVLPLIAACVAAAISAAAGFVIRPAFASLLRKVWT
ncbi:MAG: hypothetical protein R3314_00635 [Longimicrobiales bacterium]|nr:hypothetical protein [Longimicrobiales bacterium]